MTRRAQQTAAKFSIRYDDDSADKLAVSWDADSDKAWPGPDHFSIAATDSIRIEIADLEWLIDALDKLRPIVARARDGGK